MNIRTLLVLLVLLFIASLIIQYKQEEVTTFEEWEIVKPDPNREVVKWDWENSRYIYKDELPKPKKGNQKLPPKYQYDISDLTQ